MTYTKELNKYSDWTNHNIPTCNVQNKLLYSLNLRTFLKKGSQYLLNKIVKISAYMTPSKEYLNYGSYKNKIDFMSTLSFQQQCRQHNIKTKEE